MLLEVPVLNECASIVSVDSTSLFRIAELVIVLEKGGKLPVGDFNVLPSRIAATKKE